MRPPDLPIIPPDDSFDRFITDRVHAQGDVAFQAFSRGDLGAANDPRDDALIAIDRAPLQHSFDTSMDLGPAVPWTRSSVGGTRRGELVPRARYALEARVLATRGYRFDRLADVARLDVALGWQDMARDDVLDAFKINQRNRFYFWRAEHLPIDRATVERSSANVHLIAASPDIAAELRRLRVDDHVRIEGYLVDVAWESGFRAATSLTRDDTGAGACEIIWVHRVHRIAGSG
ncbi:MAG: hypothetical protein ACK4IT_02575 [Thioalkalivibrionaceae bacterium]